MAIHVRPLDPHDDRGVELAYGIHAASRAHDVPDFPPASRIDHAGRLRHLFPGEERYGWLASRRAEPVGVLSAWLSTLDNLHLMNFAIEVHPDHRRRGVGRALHATLVEFARARGRTTLGTDYAVTVAGLAERDPANAAFAAAMGATPALPEIRSRLDVDTVDIDRVRAVVNDAHGYSPVFWTDAVPDEYVADIAALDSRVIVDIPTGDLNIEPQRTDVARVRAGEETTRRRGRRAYHAAMRHDGSGRLVAWTTLLLDADSTTHAWQQITIVDPAHRGHRLGLVVKIENLVRTLAREPALRHVNTWNAAENAHMIAINTALGFRPVDGWVSCQQEI